MFKVITLYYFKKICAMGGFIAKSNLFQGTFRWIYWQEKEMNEVKGSVVFLLLRSRIIFYIL